MNLGRLPPWIVERLRSPVATAAAMTLGLRVGQELYRFVSGEITVEQFKRRAGIHVGLVTGTITGALASSIVGRWAPGVGTVLGAFAGGLGGQFLGAHVTYKSADRLATRLPGAAGDEDQMTNEDD